MSYWIRLETMNGDLIDTGTSREEGGTYQVGGSNMSELNVTYNYSKHFDFNLLHDLTAKGAMPILLKKFSELKDNEVKNYWYPTEGNTRKAISILLAFVRYAVGKNIDAVFKVN